MTTMDMSQYLDVFLEESREHLTNLNRCLLELEQQPQNGAALNEIFRAAHTLKGMSSTMGFEDLADLTHHMEDVLSNVKEAVLEVNGQVIDVLFQCFDRIQVMVESIAAGSSGDMNNMELVEILNNIKNGNIEAAAMAEQTICSRPKAASAEQPEDPPAALMDFNDYDLAILDEAASRGYRVMFLQVRVAEGCVMKSVRSFMVFKALEAEGDITKSVPPVQDLEEGKFDSGFSIVFVTQLDVEEVKKRLDSISEISLTGIRELNPDSLQAGPAEVQAENEENKPHEAQSNQPVVDDGHKIQKFKQKVRVDIEKLDQMMNLVGELVMHKGRLEQIGTISKNSDLQETVEQVDRITTELQSVVMKVRMVPIEQVFNRFPRMVRDLAKDLNKEINFIVEGQETELDRTVIDEIGDPLVHLLRNAIDHGVEAPQERIKAGKPARGTVKLRARHEGNNVYIEVDDDGKGIDVERVLQKAVDKGLITAREAEQMNPEEAFRLVFTPGFSTAAEVTDVSGRGVGLDVVKAKMEGIGGEISIASKSGAGTRFIIKLPLTLAIIQALTVSVGDEIYAIPLSNVDETTMIFDRDIKMVQNQQVIVIRGKVMPLYRLRSLLDIPGEQTENEPAYVVVVRQGERQIGLVVDTLIGQHEIVIKSLGKLLAGIPGLAGAIVAGDGNVHLILDIASLF